MGDPMKEGIKVGPLALARARKNLHRQVLDAVKAGARILTGGEIPPAPAISIRRLCLWAAARAAIAKEEFFGPVATIFPFKTDDEAIHLANSTDFGLSAAVWSVTSSGPVALPARSNLEWYLSMISLAPIPRAIWSVKASGYGRELGAPGARELTNPKLIWQGA